MFWDTRLRSKLGVDINWLALGEGSPFNNDNRQTTAIDTELFGAIFSLVTSLHDQAKIRLPLQATNDETLRHYNAISSQMLSGSDEEKGLRLNLLQIQIQKEIDVAKAEPGTGKRPAS